MTIQATEPACMWRGNEHICRCPSTLRHVWLCRVRAARAKANKAPAKSTTAAGKAPATPKQPALSPLGQPLVSDSQPQSSAGAALTHSTWLVWPSLLFGMSSAQKELCEGAQGCAGAEGISLNKAC